MERTDSDQRGGGKGMTVERRGRDYLKNMYERPMDMDNSVGIDCGSGASDGRRRAKGKH